MLASAIRYDADTATLHLSGHWTTTHLAALSDQFAALAPPPHAAIKIDAQAITHMDTGGAWLLNRYATQLRAAGTTVTLTGIAPQFQGLVALVQERQEGEAAPERAESFGVLESLGRHAWRYAQEMLAFLGFFGEAVIAIVLAVKNPRRIRWSAFLSSIEHAGVRAIPIIALLSFLLGVVIAYQGGMQLRNYGANIFIVELVSLTMLRELAPMMTAIIVAGRTGSAYTAEIGTMKVTEEVDALRTLSIAPMDMLVLPKVFGLLIALPLLTLVADALGVAGGMVMASSMLGVSYHDFLHRFPLVISERSFWIGIGKAPAFALIVALVGCFQGFKVVGGADAVGRQTTISVVQAIFLVIVADAGFSVLFGWLKI